MRAAAMYGAGDVWVEDVPDARLIEPADALVRVTRAAICGSDLWTQESHRARGRREAVNIYTSGVFDPARSGGTTFWASYPKS